MENSTALFGKALKVSVPSSGNWKKLRRYGQSSFFILPNRNLDPTAENEIIPILILSLR
jgi:hypothetical protein